MLEDHLEQAERHVAIGRAHIRRQRELIVPFGSDAPSFNRLPAAPVGALQRVQPGGLCLVEGVWLGSKLWAFMTTISGASI